MTKPERPHVSYEEDSIRQAVREAYFETFSAGPWDEQDELDVEEFWQAVLTRLRAYGSPSSST